MRDSLLGILYAAPVMLGDFLERLLGIAVAAAMVVVAATAGDGEEPGGEAALFAVMVEAF